MHAKVGLALQFISTYKICQINQIFIYIFLIHTFFLLQKNEIYFGPSLYMFIDAWEVPTQYNKCANRFFIGSPVRPPLPQTWTKTTGSREKFSSLKLPTLNEYFFTQPPPQKKKIIIIKKIVFSYGKLFSNKSNRL